jgi:hypothetical protein
MYTWRLKRSDSGGCATSAARYNVNLHKFTFVHDVPFHHFTELKASSQPPEAKSKRLKANSGLSGVHIGTQVIIAIQN